MKLIVILCILIVSVCGFERKSEEYKKALFSVADEVTKQFEVEYRKYVETGVQSESLQTLISMLRPTQDIRKREIENLAVTEQANVCILCRAGVNILLSYRREGKDDNFMFDLITGLCENLHLQTKDVCEGLIVRNLPILLYIIDHRQNLTEKTICGVLLQGSNCEYADPDFDWKLEIDDGKEIVSSKPKTPSENSNSLTILQISDIHFDPLYQTGGLAVCEEPLCCRRTDVKLKNPSEGAGKWGDYRDCDVSWEMYEDAVNHIAKEHKDIDYIYFTGDVIDHGVWDTTNEGNSESIKRVNDYLKKVFPKPKIFPLVGNHETNPLNVFAPHYIEKDLNTQWLYDFLAKEWSSWLPPSAIETVKIGGYYTVVPQKGFRIIALNNNDCYTFNFWLLLDPQYLSHQLKWLHDTLLEAEKAGEQVHILKHIPSGGGSCLNTWSREYRRLIDRFHKIIAGNFVGHTHYDEFNVYYDQSKSAYAVNVAWNGGSLTPFSFLNPNYRVYSVDSQNYEILEHDTWIYNITLANLTPDKSPVWYKEYSFKDAYGLSDLSPASLNKLLHNFAKDETLLNSYWERKVKKGDPSLEKGCENSCLLNHLCEMAVTQSNDVRKCEELQGLFIEMITPSTEPTTESENSTNDQQQPNSTNEPTDVTTHKPNSASKQFINFNFGIIIFIISKLNY